jgi:hypothetical protein
VAVGGRRLEDETTDRMRKEVQVYLDIHSEEEMKRSR